MSNGFYTFIFLTLTGSYISIAFISRFVILVWLFFLVGFSGAILSGFSFNVDRRFPTAQFQKRKDDLDLNRQIERGVVCFMFSTLLTAFLYDNRPHVEFPCYYLSILLLSSFILMILYYFILQRTIGKRSNLSSVSHTSKPSGPLEKKSIYDQPDNVVISESEIKYAGDVPLNFLNCCRGDLAKARAMYGKMLAWRRQYNVDQIFDTPQRGFHDFVKYYPHAIHGYSRDGCGVVYEILGQGKPVELRNTGHGIDQLVWHFNLRNEVVFRHVLDPERVRAAIERAPPGAIAVTPFESVYANDPGAMKEPVRRMMTVVDLAGISFSSFSAEVVSFLTKSGHVIDNYYPEQVARIVVINAPIWFHSIWSILKGVFPKSVLQKVDIGYDCSNLDKFVHPSQRPPEYGGTDVALGQWDGHRFFLGLADSWASQPAPAAAPVEPSQPSKDVPADSAAQGRPGGRLMEWLSARFKKAPPAAFLGEKNTYKYNQTSGKWELDVQEESLLHPAGFSAASSEEENSDDDDDGRDPADKTRPFRRPHLGRSVSSREKASGSNSSVAGGGLKRNDSLDFAFQHAAAPATQQTVGQPTASRKKKAAKMSRDQLEEHGLVLAIHAAHFASKYSKRPDQPLSLSSNQILSRSESGVITANLAANTVELGLGRSEPLIANDVAESDASREAAAAEATPMASKPGDGHIFVMTLLIFGAAHVSHSLVWTLLPVWLSAPLRSGGLGYSVRDLGLLLSTTALFVLTLHRLFQGKVELLLKASPVRSLRIGCGLLLLACFALMAFMRRHLAALEESFHHWPHLSLPLGHASASSPLLSAEQSLLAPPHHAAASSSGPLLSADDEAAIIGQLLRLLPSLSFASLLLPAALLAVLVSALHLCRRSSAILFQLAISSSFKNFAIIRSSLTACVEVMGPSLSCLVYSLVFSMRLRYPLDSSFFLSVSNCLVLAAYMASLQLVVQFRGDYGLMSDDQELAAPAFSWPFRQAPEQPASVEMKPFAGRQDGQSRRRHGGPSSGPETAPSSSLGSASQDPRDQQTATALAASEHPLAVPLGDLRLLFASIGNSYGSKLYNLKDDFKDV